MQDCPQASAGVGEPDGSTLRISYQLRGWISGVEPGCPGPAPSSDCTPTPSRYGDHSPKEGLQLSEGHGRAITGLPLSWHSWPWGHLMQVAVSVPSC